jgi:hypothetical protein
VIDQERVAEIVDRIDLPSLPICPLCHLDLAFAIRDGEARRAIAAITTRTCGWVWGEIETELRAQLRRASMREQAWADEALADLDAHGFRSQIVRGLVTRVATVMAAEIRREEGMPRPLALTFPRR